MKKIFLSKVLLCLIATPLFLNATETESGQTSSVYNIQQSVGTSSDVAKPKQQQQQSAIDNYRNKGLSQVPAQTTQNQDGLSHDANTQAISDQNRDISSQEDQNASLPTQQLEQTGQSIPQKGLESARENEDEVVDIASEQQNINQPAQRLGSPESHKELGLAVANVD